MPFDGRILSGVSVLAAVVEGGSFVKAAELTGITDSGVSRAISRLETRLNVRLLDRTDGELAPLDEVRPSVLDLWKEDEDSRRLRRWLDERRRSTRVVVREVLP